MLNHWAALILIFLFYINCGNEVFASSQNSLPDIERVKAEINDLTAEIDHINGQAAQELELASKEPAKGEFETTAQFEARRSNYYDTLFEKQKKISQSRKTQLAEVMKRLGPLLQIEFSKPLAFNLGRYDADAQQFPLYKENGILIGNLSVPLAEAPMLKEHFNDATTSGKFSLYVDFSDQIRELLLGVQANFRGKTYKTATQEMTADRAMKLLYKDYNHISKRATVEFHKAELMEGTFDNSEPTFASPFFQQTYMEGEKQKFIMLTGAKPEYHDCHACGVLVGAAIFTKNASGWRVELAQRSIGRYFSWGNTGEPKIVKIGENYKAIAFEWGDGNQGFFGGDFYILTDIDYSFREVARFESYEDNSGAVGGIIGRGEYVNVRGKYEFVSRPNTKYFDIKVTYSGRKGSGKGRLAVIKPYSKVVWYKFIKDKYVEYRQ